MEPQRQHDQPFGLLGSSSVLAGVLSEERSLDPGGSFRWGHSGRGFGGVSTDEAVALRRATALRCRN